MKNKKEKPKSIFSAIILTQFICVIILISEVAVLKYLLPKYYKKAARFIESTLFEDTDSDELQNLIKNEI